ncbi:unnamed protein product [Rhizoctonia solani]|uniref:EVE domain-containing protein n=1 Tax=Rhizoctonia solani TaxID=456999 RepID=A0A8H2X0S5_9AGAM|nr:unnamed protein product [Rhizoctonia solani]
MGHGLGPDSDSELSSAPPSPRLEPISITPSLPPEPPQELSYVIEPAWKTRPRPKRQSSTTVPNPPSSPKRPRRGEASKGKETEKGNGNDASSTGTGTTGKGKAKEVGATGRKGGAKAVGKVKPNEPTLDEPAGPKPGKLGKTDKMPKSAPSVKAASRARAGAATPKSALPDVDTTPAPLVKKPPFARVKSKPETKPTSSNTSESTPSDPAPVPPPATKPAPFAKSTSKPKPAPSTTTSKPAPTPSDSSKPAPVIKPAPFKTKRPTFNESADSSDEEHEEQHTSKRHKRRKSHVEPTPKAARKPRPSLPPKAKPKLEPASGPLELRPASFLTRTGSLSFMSKPTAPLKSVNAPAGDVWSCDDLTGLTWVKLDVGKCEIVRGNERAEQWCWWPAEVLQNTSNGLKFCLCGLGIERELGPDAVAETNVLAFRKPNISSVRFPTFKTALSPLEVLSGSGAPSTGEPSNQPAGETSNQPAGETSARPASTPPESPTILPTSPSALEALWKQALTRAFEIDTESNDGLVDIHLLFSQKSQSSREEDELSGNTALEEQEQSEDEDEDILENGTTVLCRYRTRYYPAKIIAYHPREGKAKRRAGAKGKYKCRFADDSTKIATRQEIMTSLDNGFATCPLGSYHQYTSNTHQKPSGVREPSPAPRAHSPSPEPDETQIEPEEYCSRERMRDQLKPVLPFLKGFIERTYVPGKGAESLSNPDTHPVLDRHAIFMQGGRARKNLAYSVHTGDLNEDDCEELMFEISRWALRGERWACQEVEKAMNREGGEDMSREGGEDTSREVIGQAGKEDKVVAQVVQQGETTKQESGDGDGASGVIPEDENASQDVQMEGELDTEVGANSQEPGHKEIVENSPDVDVEMQDARQETSSGQDTPSQPQAKSGDSTELEDEPLKVVRILEKMAPSVHGDFRSLVKLQPPRPIGAPDYEELTPEERMGYVSDVLYPEAAALILSYRRGIRTQPGPLADPVAEHALYTAGLQAAKNTCSAFDWVEQILSVRQLRSANSKYQVEDQAQVVVAGGTKSRPRYPKRHFQTVHTANDATHPYYDPKSSSRDPKSEPTWWMVELQFKSRLKHFVSLAMLRSITSVTSVDDLAQFSADSEDGQHQLSYLSPTDLKALGDMPLLNRGRLSVQSVNEGAWIAINKLAEKGGWSEQSKSKPAKVSARSAKLTGPAKPKKTTKREAPSDAGAKGEKDDETCDKPDADPPSTALRRSKRRKP